MGGYLRQILPYMPDAWRTGHICSKHARREACLQVQAVQGDAAASAPGQMHAPAAEVLPELRGPVAQVHMRHFSTGHDPSKGLGRESHAGDLGQRAITPCIFRNEGCEWTTCMVAAAEPSSLHVGLRVLRTPGAVAEDKELEPSVGQGLHRCYGIWVWVLAVMQHPKLIEEHCLRR